MQLGPVAVVVAQFAEPRRQVGEAFGDHVDDALSSGARALVGGKRVEGPGDYFEPTVLVDVDHSMKVMRDETFGPVVGIMPVRDDEAAIALMNDCRYGLGSSVWTQDAGERALVESRGADFVDVNLGCPIDHLWRKRHVI